MNIPAFPAQDLAKLVLGYLAEEQLMTAYDEFLSASPYLDALRNEYDRIFMTSLKNILAEYRAVKIYVETCKPLSLRRRLFGCTNLLEVVKFLIQNLDINKIQSPDGNRRSYISQSTDQQSSCAVCNSLKLSSCVCKSRLLQAQSSSTNCVDGSSAGSSVETTSLDDLPGNHASIRKKHVKILCKESRVLTQQNDHNMGTFSEGSFTPNVAHTGSSHTYNLPSRLPHSTAAESTPMNHDPVQMVKKMEVFTNESISNREISSNTAGTFQDFSNGVRDPASKDDVEKLIPYGADNLNSTVPDSSTSESVQPLSSKDSGSVRATDMTPASKKQVSKAHIMLTVGSRQTTSSRKSIETLPGNNKDSFTRLKASEQKVTILSDIKVDKAFNNDGTNMPAVLKNATSTPLMQTIFINGTPVYKPQPATLGTKRNFTKDEIMAMPTIIVVPKSGASQMPTCIKPGVTQPANPPSSNASSTNLGPLVIDVPFDSPQLNEAGHASMPIIDQQKENEKEVIVKSLEIKNITVPKDNEVSNKNTPQVAVPVRKSSSTPRRSSHVRVLDFTTPRRILQETINENPGESSGTSVEVLVSKSPNLHTLADPTCVSNETVDETEKSSKLDCKEMNNTGSCRENENIPPLTAGTRNWDADLRAVAIPNSKEELKQVPDSKIKPGCRRPTNHKKKHSTDKKSSEKLVSNKSSADTKSKAKTTHKTKTSKSKRKSVESNEDDLVIVVDDTSSVPVKPTINIITAPDWKSPQESDKNASNKSNNVDQTDTPDMDRISLQNVIGAKLNISDLLETPYKQALYDIQMDTPRFLGPDLPGDPMSDIKIMNIPTPRFFNNTPKPQGTPYISRPTDYSSGSSYYKPDDQDLPVDLGYPNQLTKEKDSSVNVDVETFIEKSNKSKGNSSKSSRPVRKCTKNVSYVNSPANKPKDALEQQEVASICSETVNIKSSGETKTGKELAKAGKVSKTKTKRNSTSRKTKTPTKKDTPRSFMKIKPRRLTPVKGKGRPKKKEEQVGKRPSSKEKASEASLVVISAPTKSRRKSSTPRKLHCTKTFNSESSSHESPENTPRNKENVLEKPHNPYPADSDSEQVPLRWSDDGSQDAKSKELQGQEADDITRIKEYIASELRNTSSSSKLIDIGSNLHVDLVKRGFDRETAKIIERDLLDTPPHTKECNNIDITSDASKSKKEEAVLDKTLESDTSNSLKIVQDEDDEDEVELSSSECFEGSENYISCVHDDETELQTNPPVKLKDKFSMEVCIDDGVVVRLRATPLTVMLDQDIKEDEIVVEHIDKESEIAVSSLSDMDKMYTPMKESIRAQVYDIFESTLTSLDTPLKAASPKKKECDTTVTEIVLEVEKVEDTDKTHNLNRKRQRSEESTDSPISSKKPKDAHSLLSTASNFNFDIESVLSKLHGSEK